MAHPAYIDEPVRRSHLRSSVLAIYVGASAMSYPVARDLLLMLGWTSDEVKSHLEHVDLLAREMEPQSSTVVAGGEN